MRAETRGRRPASAGWAGGWAVWMVLLAGLLLAPLACQKEGGRSSAGANGAPPDGQSGAAQATPATATTPGGTQATGEETAEAAEAAEPAESGAAATAAGGGPAGSAGDRPNRAPRALLQVDPLRGYANMTSIHLTSATSADDFDLATEMKRRWDFDGDGKWDTGPMRPDFVQWTYKVPGIFRPRLLLTDSGGLSDTCSGPEIEILAPCPAPEFTLEDINGNSPSHTRVFNLAGFRGRPLLVWFSAPSK